MGLPAKVLADGETLLVVLRPHVKRLLREAFSLEAGELRDCAIVGIGIVPAVAPLLAAGAKGGNGVEVDEHCRTSLPHIYAIGDCAAHANVFADGTVLRVESVQNANDQASCAVKAIVGDPHPYAATPWFWSFQGDLKLQIAGLSDGPAAHVVRGRPEDERFSVLYYRGGRLLAVDAVNRPADYMAVRAALGRGAGIAPDRAADPDVPLKSLIEEPSCAAQNDRV